MLSKMREMILRNIRIDRPYISRSAGECVVQWSFSSHLTQTKTHPSSRIRNHFMSKLDATIRFNVIV